MPDCVKRELKNLLASINQLFISAENKVKNTFFADE
ncbi:uncharacterized protein METZ01_LOCUS103876 [marine metagenome]|uniref:Uncharacterized protein n=1 Tax=marine metagenome TaxID=408172 RepID=A0A381WEY9_9ZZZZ|tara:strand:- start:102 stop:209 length:108 start_codon:yes stop_codon:yes gene_type:complete